MFSIVYITEVPCAQLSFTILDSFAGMFPDKVGRLVIDGVVNSHDWYAGKSSWLTNARQP